VAVAGVEAVVVVVVVVVVLLTRSGTVS
jgi:hypothetical protein